MLYGNMKKFIITYLEKNSSGHFESFGERNKWRLDINAGDRMSVEFEADNAISDWPAKVESLSPTIYIEGSVNNLSSDSRSVMDALIVITNKKSYNHSSINNLVIYDNSSKTTAIKKPGLQGIFTPKNSNKVINMSPYSWDLIDVLNRKAQEPGLGEGVKILTAGDNILEIFSRFLDDRKAYISNLTIGESPAPKMEVDYKTAKECVFKTPLKRIMHADVNCLTRKGVMVEEDPDAGALHIRNGKTIMKTRTKEKMLDFANILL